MNREAVNILFPIVTPGSRPGAKYGYRYLLDEWMDEMTGVGWCRLPHADGILCHLMYILNIIECCWFNWTRNSRTYLTWPFSECTSQGLLTKYLLINGNRQKRSQLHILITQCTAGEICRGGSDVRRKKSHRSFLQHNESERTDGLTSSSLLVVSY